MSDEIQTFRALLLQGISLSQQSSYARRAPARAAIPFLERARTGLRALVARDGRNAVGWRLLSQAEECLLNYPAAIECLQNGIELTGYADNKERKRLALLKQVQVEWLDSPCRPMSWLPWDGS